MLQTVPEQKGSFFTESELEEMARVPRSSLASFSIGKSPRSPMHMPAASHSLGDDNDIQDLVLLPRKAKIAMQVGRKSLTPSKKKKNKYVHPNRQSDLEREALEKVAKMKDTIHKLRLTNMELRKDQADQVRKV